MNTVNLTVAFDPHLAATEPARPGAATARLAPGTRLRGGGGGGGCCGGDSCSDAGVSADSVEARVSK